MNKDNYDLNNNGTIDPDEKALLLDDRKRRIDDADAKRDESRGGYSDFADIYVEW